LKIHEIAVFAVAAAVCTTAFAGTDDVKASNNQIEVQAISTKVDYKETGNGRLHSRAGTLDTEDGHVPGFALSVSMMKDVLLGNDYLQLQYSRNNGDTRYTGALQSGGSFGSVGGHSSATISDYSLRWGKGFAIDEAFMITPYGELGHHEWQRGVNSGETYNHSWYGVGTLVQYSPVSRLVVSANALVGRTFASDIDVSGPRGFSGSLGDSTLYKAGLSTDYAFTKHFHGNVGVDYTNFKYGISSTHRTSSTTVAWEPDSKTEYTTLKVGVGYAF
jgi:hypothetical protein